MSGKKHGGVLGDLFEIAAMLPWWIGAALAVGAYFVFHSLAGVDLAAYLQYLLPLALFGAAAASAIAQFRRRAK